MAKCLMQVPRRAGMHRLILTHVATCIATCTSVCAPLADVRDCTYGVTEDLLFASLVAFSFIVHLIRKHRLTVS